MADNIRISPEEEHAQRLALGPTRLIPSGSLLPKAREAYERLVKDNPNEPAPAIIVDNGRPDKQGMSTVFHAENGAPFILVPEAARRWTEQDAKENSLTAEEIASVSTTPYSNPEVQTQLKAMVKKLNDQGYNIKEPRLLAIEREKINSLGAAYAVRDGDPVIFMDPNLSTQDALGVLAHELGHVANKDLSPASLAAVHNDESGQLTHARERRADSKAVELCQGEKFADAMDPNYQDVKRIAAARGISLAEFERELDPHHPAIGPRLDFARQGADIEVAAGRCPVDPSLIDRSITQPMQRMAGGEHVVENGAALGVSAGKAASRDRPH